MERRNIFDLLDSNINYKNEIKKIEEMMHFKRMVSERLKIFMDDFSYSGTFTSIVEYVDNNYFIEWKYRHTCMNYKDFLKTLGLWNLQYAEDISAQSFLLYLEAVLNYLNLYQNIEPDSDTIIDISDKMNVLYQNIISCLDHFGMESIEIEKGQRILIVEKDAAATSVAELLPDDYAIEVYQYNSFRLKGDLVKKKEILGSLGRHLEAKRQKLKEAYSRLDTDVFNLLNGLDIRHNNVEDKDSRYYKEFVANMDSAQLEELYDDLYQMILLSFLMIDEIERKQRLAPIVARIKEKVRKTQTKTQEAENGQDEDAE